MKKVTILALLGLLVLSTSAFAVETTVGGRIYAYWGMYMTSDVYAGDVEISGMNQFGLDRSYVTVKSKLTDYTSINITSDLADGYSDGFWLRLKYAYANIDLNFIEGLSFSLGLQPTKYLEYADNMLWQRRYLLPSVGNEASILTTADLGATFNYAFGEEGKTGAVGLSVLNGTAYDDLYENNKNKDFNFYAAFFPLIDNPDFDQTMLIGQFYLGTQNTVLDTTEDAGDYKNQIISFGGKFNYKQYFDFGAEYWMNTLGTGAGNDDLKVSALSFYTAWYAKAIVAEDSPIRTLNLLFRYDMYDPNTDVDDDGSNLMLIGLECAPAQGINASINYRSLGYQASGVDSDNYIFLNTEFRF